MKQLNEKKKLKLLDYNKYDYNNLKIRSQSFTINNNNQIGKNNKFKISLKDIFNNCDYESHLPEKIKLFKDKKYLLSHPKLDYNGYINNSNGKLSNIVNEKLNRIPKETFGVNLRSKLQSNKKTFLCLSFSPTKFKIEGIRSNKNIKNLKS